MKVKSIDTFKAILTALPNLAETYYMALFTASFNNTCFLFLAFENMYKCICIYITIVASIIRISSNLTQFFVFQLL